MKRILLLSILAVSLIALTFNSCKKDKPDTETQSAVDNNICEGEFIRILPTVNGFGMKENGLRGMQVVVCPTFKIDSFSTTVAKILTIDYGTGCTDSLDHKIRKGKIICRFYQKNWSTSIPGNITVTLQNYYVNNVGYSADSITISRDAANTFTNVIYNGQCVGSGWSLEWAATRTTTQTGGTTTPFDPSDDVFKVTGNANGRNRNGLAYTVNITSPLVKRASCTWIESGRMDLTPQGMATRTIDFGNGACDNQGTLTINGNPFTFTLN